MIDIQIRKLIDPPLDRIAGGLAKLGIGANAVTVFGFGLGLVCCAFIALQWYWLGLIFLLLNRIADGLDGAIARRTAATDLGGFLDAILDTIFYSAVPFAFAIADAQNTLPAAFLIFSFVGTGGSFLAYAIIAAKRKRAEPSGKKSFFYSVGLMEGTETILFFVAFCLWPQGFPLLAWIFGSLCWLTTALRILAGVRDFRTPSETTP